MSGLAIGFPKRHWLIGSQGSLGIAKRLDRGPYCMDLEGLQKGIDRDPRDCKMGLMVTLGIAKWIDRDPRANFHKGSA